MPQYMAAWETFRAVSDENLATAEYLLSSPSWPKATSPTICDIGCADGQLVGALLKSPHLRNRVSEVRLVDPNIEWLEKAADRIENSRLADSVRTFPCAFQDVWPKCATGSDVILAVHMVYLISEKELEQLVLHRPTASTLYVILDAPDSVFTELWSITAKKYHARVVKAHQLLQQWSKSAPGLGNRIRAKLPREYLFDHDYSDWLLTILCYKSMHTLKNIRRWEKPVKEILERRTDRSGKFVECQSICYEFPSE